MEERKVGIIEPTPFPMAMLNFKVYDGAKTFGLIVFAIGTLYFMNGLYNFFFWEDSWYKPDGAMKLIFFFYHMTVFTLVYCFSWLIFDKNGIEGYALAVFSTVFGFIYMVSPLDFVPDALPVIGNIDDAVIGLGSIIMGFRSYSNYKNGDKLKDNMVEMIKDGRKEEAIGLFLKENGYIVKND